MENVVHGFKVFNSDWTCSPQGNTKQYSCPGKFEEEGEIDVCEHGMHFCQTAVDCFNYYSFNPENKVAEVIAYGDVKKEGNKYCTNKLEIVREIPWDEVLRLVNIGKRNTGFCNSGDYNSGDYNSGNRNSGDYNSGDYNSGNRNRGNYNSGNCNIGFHNTGDYNSGDYNKGDWNSGDSNSGDYNCGDGNIGDWNSGDGNIGDWNSGKFNRGNYNTGDWNKSSYNTGCFNTESHKIFLFNKPSDWSYNDWLCSQARLMLNGIPKNVVEWVYSDHMTDDEKAAHSSYVTTGGYLKVLDESECSQIWWNRLSDNEKNIVKSIPNFDAEIFFQCTGIRVDNQSESE